MKTSRMAIQMALMAMAAGNAIPARTEPTPIRIEQRQKKRKTGLSPLFANPYAGRESTEARRKRNAIRLHNDSVDQKNRDRWYKRYDRVKNGPAKKRLSSPSPHGTTTIDILLRSYQAQARAIRQPLELQHKAEFDRRCRDRSRDGVGREAHQMTQTRGRRMSRISKSIGGNATRIVVRLVNLQQSHADSVRQQKWEDWIPTDSPNIWENERLATFMFSDETGDLFEADAGKMAFLSKEKAEEALRAYISHLKGGITEEELSAQFEALAVRANIEVHSAETRCDHQLYKDGDADIPDAIKDRNGQVALDCCKVCGEFEAGLSDDAADDENYALKGDA